MTNVKQEILQRFETKSHYHLIHLTSCTREKNVMYSFFENVRKVKTKITIPWRKKKSKGSSSANEFKEKRRINQRKRKTFLRKEVIFFLSLNVTFFLRLQIKLHLFPGEIVFKDFSPFIIFLTIKPLLLKIIIVFKKFCTLK